MEPIDPQEEEGSALQDPPLQDGLDEAKDNSTAQKPAIIANSGSDITDTMARRVLPVLQKALVRIFKLDLSCLNIHPGYCHLSDLCLTNFRKILQL